MNHEDWYGGRVDTQGTPVLDSDTKNKDTTDPGSNDLI